LKHYNGSFCVDTITDAIGQVTALTYGTGATGQYVITQITDPFGETIVALYLLTSKNRGGTFSNAVNSYAVSNQNSAGQNNANKANKATSLSGLESVESISFQVCARRPSCTLWI
jgi:hypothetical protein